MRGLFAFLLFLLSSLHSVRCVENVIDCSSLTYPLYGAQVQFSANISVAINSTAAYYSVQLSLTGELYDYSSTYAYLQTYASVSTALTTTSWPVNTPQLVQVPITLTYVLPPSTSAYSQNLLWTCQLVNSITGNVLATNQQYTYTLTQDRFTPQAYTYPPLALYDVNENLFASYTAVGNLAENQVALAGVPDDTFFKVGAGPTTVVMWSPFDWYQYMPIVQAMERLCINTRDTKGNDIYTFVLYATDYNTVTDAPFCPSGGSAWLCPSLVAIGTTELPPRINDFYVLDDLIETYAEQTGDYITDDFVNYYFYLLNINSHWYGLPYTTDTRNFNFNVTTFNSLGLKFPPPFGDWTQTDGSSSWNWETFVSYARIIKEQTGTIGWDYYSCLDEEFKLIMVLAQDSAATLTYNVWDPVAETYVQQCNLRNSNNFKNLLDQVVRQVWVVDQSATVDYVDYQSWALSNFTQYGPEVCRPNGAYFFGMEIDNYGAWLNSTSDIYVGYLPSQSMFLGGSVLAIPANTVNVTLGWNLMTYLVNPAYPFLSLAQSNNIPPYTSALESAEYTAARWSIQNEQIKIAKPSNYPSAPWPQYNVLGDIHPMRGLMMDIIFRNFTTDDAVEAMCQTIDQIFLPTCLPQYIRYNISNCSADTMEQTVDYFWILTCQSGTGAVPLPPSDNVMCDYIPTTSSIADVYTAAIAVAAVITLLPVMWCFWFTVQFWRHTAAFVTEGGQTSKLNINPVTIITLMGWFRLGMFYVGCAALLATVLINVGELTPTLCESRLVLTVMGMVFLLLPLAESILVLRKHLQRLLFSQYKFNMKLYAARGIIIGANLGLLLSFYSQSLEAPILYTTTTSNGGATIVNAYCNVGTTLMSWILLVGNAIWLIPPFFMLFMAAIKYLSDSAHFQYKGALARQHANQGVQLRTLLYTYFITLLLVIIILSVGWASSLRLSNLYYTHIHNCVMLVLVCTLSIVLFLPSYSAIRSLINKRRQKRMEKLKKDTKDKVRRANLHPDGTRSPTNGPKKKSKSPVISTAHDSSHTGSESESGFDSSSTHNHSSTMNMHSTTYSVFGHDAYRGSEAGSLGLNSLQGALANPIITLFLHRHATTSLDGENVSFLQAHKQYVNLLNVKAGDLKALVNNRRESDLLVQVANPPARLSQHTSALALNDAAPLLNTPVTLTAIEALPSAASPSVRPLDAPSVITAASDADEALSHIPSVSAVMSGAQDLMQSYVNEGAKEEINISGRQRSDAVRDWKQLQHLASQETNAHHASLALRAAAVSLFAASAKEVFNLIQTNTWSRFVSSTQAERANELVGWASMFEVLPAAEQKAVLQRFIELSTDNADEEQ